MRFRRWVAHRLTVLAVRITIPTPTLEGITIMSIRSRLAALEAATAANAAALASHGETITGFATTEEVDVLSSKVSDLASSVGGRLDTIEAEIGSDEPVVDPGVKQTAMTADSLGSNVSAN